MNNPGRRQPIHRILVDMNTQFDFLLPRGTLPVTNRGDIIPNIRKIMNWGRIEQIPIISTLESHREGEVLRGLPPYCVDHTIGQRKLPFTLMARRLVLVGDNTLDVPFDCFRKYQQLIFTKRNRDFLSNPKADRLVNITRVNYYVVFGVVTEHCVKAAALGLMTRQNRVVVVSDACGFWSLDDHELALRQVEAKGALLVTTDELVSGVAEERILATPLPRPTCDEEADALAASAVAAGRLDFDSRPQGDPRMAAAGSNGATRTGRNGQASGANGYSHGGNGHTDAHRPDNGSANANGNGHAKDSESAKPAAASRAQVAAAKLLAARAASRRGKARRDLA